MRAVREVDVVAAAELFDQHGRLVIVGPPGVGKAELAQAIASRRPEASLLLRAEADLSKGALPLNERVVATSCFRPSGAITYNLQPLPVGTAVHPGEALTFWTECAARARSDYSPTEPEHALAICRLLGGIPAAIAGAAQRLVVLSERDLRRALEAHPAEVLGRRGGLSDDIERVVSMLPHEVRETLAELAAVPGGGTRAELHALVSTPEAIDVLLRWSLLSEVDGRVRPFRHVQAFREVREIERASSARVAEVYGRRLYPTAEPTTEPARRTLTAADRENLAAVHRTISANPASLHEARVRFALGGALSGLREYRFELSEVWRSARLLASTAHDAELRCLAGFAVAWCMSNRRAGDDVSVAVALQVAGGVTGSVRTHLESWIEAVEAAQRFDWQAACQFASTFELDTLLVAQRLQVARWWRMHGKLEQAARWLDGALSASSEPHDPWRLRASVWRAWVALDQGDARGALERLARAELTCGARWPKSLVMRVGALRAAAFYELGEPDAAVHALSSTLEGAGRQPGRGEAELWLGDLHRVSGARLEARSVYRGLMRSSRTSVDTRVQAMAALASLDADDDRVTEARAGNAQALALVRGRRDVVAGIVALEAQFEALALARRSAARGDADDVRLRTRAVRAQLRRLAAPQGGDHWTARGRLLYRAVEDGCRALRASLATGVGATTVPPDGALVLDVDGVWMPNDAYVDLRRRRTLRPLLARLVSARTDSPGQPVSEDELLATVWSDERWSDPRTREVLIRRLQVAVSQLRTLGLGPRLVYHAGGYCLDPTLRVGHRSG